MYTLCIVHNNTYIVLFENFKISTIHNTYKTWNELVCLKWEFYHGLTLTWSEQVCSQISHDQRNYLNLFARKPPHAVKWKKILTMHELIHSLRDWGRGLGNIVSPTLKSQGKLFSYLWMCNITNVAHLMLKKYFGCALDIHLTRTQINSPMSLWKPSHLSAFLWSRARNILIARIKKKN